MDERRQGGAGAVIASVPLGLLTLLGVIAGLAGGQSTASGYIETSSFLLIHVGFGGGAVLLFALGIVQGLRQMGGKPVTVPAVVFPFAGACAAGLWGFFLIGASGS